MTTGPDAPVLTKINTPSDKETNKLLSSIDSRLNDIPAIFEKNEKKKVKTKIPRNTDNITITSLKKELRSFQSFISKDMNVSGLSDSDIKKYSELQNKTFEKFGSKIEDSLGKYRDQILSKKTAITETDKKNLAVLTELEKQFRKNVGVKREDPIAELRETIAAFVTPLEKGVDVDGLNAKDRKAYLKEQNEISYKKQEEIRDALIDTKKAILSKETLTDEDKQSLKDIANYQQALQVYGVKKDTKFNKWANEKTEELNTNIKQGRNDLSDALGQTLLGPLNLIFKPLADVFDFKLSSLFGKDDEFTKKGKKVKPRRADILKSNPEIVYLLDEQKKLSEISEKGTSKDSSGIVDSALGSLTGAALMPLLKSLIPLMLPILGTALVAGGMGYIIWDLVTGDERAADLKKKRDIENQAEANAKVSAGMTPSGRAEYEKTHPTTVEGVTALKEAQLSEANNPNRILKEKNKPVIESNKPAYLNGGWSFFVDDNGALWTELNGTSKQQIPDLSTADKIKLVNRRADAKKLGSDKDKASFFDMMMEQEGGHPLKFHIGGTVPGKPNQEVPAILKAGERVLTKSQQQGFDSADMQANISAISKAFEQATQGNEIVNKLTKLIETIEKKPFNNMVQNISSNTVDFNSLRGVLS